MNCPYFAIFFFLFSALTEEACSAGTMHIYQGPLHAEPVRHDHDKEIVSEGKSALLSGVKTGIGALLTGGSLLYGFFVVRMGCVDRMTEYYESESNMICALDAAQLTCVTVACMATAGIYTLYQMVNTCKHGIRWGKSLCKQHTPKTRSS